MLHKPIHFYGINLIVDVADNFKSTQSIIDSYTP